MLLYFAQFFNGFTDLFFVVMYVLEVRGGWFTFNEIVFLATYFVYNNVQLPFDETNNVKQSATEYIRHLYD